MKTREQIYSREATENLRDISTYHYIRHDQLLRLYPQKKKEVIDNLISYLVRQGRIFYEPDRDWFTMERKRILGIGRGNLRHIVTPQD